MVILRNLQRKYCLTKPSYLFVKRHQHRLVTLGDSLSQGFINGAAYDGAFSYPALLARCLGEGTPFRQPHFHEQGGLPLNIEVLLRGIEQEFGDAIEWDEAFGVSNSIYATLRRIKKYWDDEQNVKQPYFGLPYHNQSSWGLGVNDVWDLSDDQCRAYTLEHPPENSPFDLLPTYPKYTSFRRVVNPNQSNGLRKRSLFANVEDLSEHGGIENLIVFLGANNILGAIVELDLILSEPDEVEMLPFNRKYTVLRPEHFEKMFRELAEKVSNLNVENIITATIPYVSIPPAIRPIRMDDSKFNAYEEGYADYYTQFWIWEDYFDPNEHAHLTRDQMIQLDLYIDEYNAIIESVAAEYGWLVAPFFHYVSRLHNKDPKSPMAFPFPDEFISALQRNSNLKHLVDNQNNVKLTTDYIEIDPETGKLRNGGVFSLDGLHPTTTAYGLMASLFKGTMERAGITFEQDLDWDEILRNDTLLTHPPLMIPQMKEVLNVLTSGSYTSLTRLSNNLINQMLSEFSW